MKLNLGVMAAAAGILSPMLAAAPSYAQKQGGTLRVAHFDSPPSMSLLEESTVAANRPMMGVFNNLVVFDQHVPQNSPKSIVPDLATSWAWNEEGTELTMPLRQGVKWHDGRPFTAKDVVCTWDLLAGKSAEKLRINPRQSWYENLEQISTKGDYEVTFHLKRAQPSFLSLLASGWSPIYPCHVPPREMRQHPIGTGPFKFVSFKPNQSITVTRNPDYWKKGLPHLDGIEWDVIKDMSTRTLAFIAGKEDLIYGVTTPVLKQVKSEAPQAICEEVTANVNRNLLVNREKPPFDNADIRRAMSLTLDRKAFVDILYEGKAFAGAAMEPPPDGLWGLPPETLKLLPGYGPDVEKSRVEARRFDAKGRLWPRQEAPDQGFGAQCAVLPRSGRDPDRPAEADLHRRRARHARHHPMVSDGDAQGLQRRTEHHRERGRRSRHAILRELRVRRPAQLHQLLQQAGRCFDR